MSVINQMLRDLDVRYRDEAHADEPEKDAELLVEKKISKFEALKSPAAKRSAIILAIGLPLIAISYVYLPGLINSGKELLTQKNTHEQIPQNTQKEVAGTPTETPVKGEDEQRAPGHQLDSEVIDEPVIDIVEEDNFDNKDQLAQEATSNGVDMDEKVMSPEEIAAQTGVVTMVGSGQNVSPLPADKVATSENEKGDPQSGVLPQQTEEATEDDSFIEISKVRIPPQQAAEQSYLKAANYLEEGKYRQAEEELMKVLQLDPNHSAARTQLVGLWLDRREYNQAVNILVQGISLDPDNIDLRVLTASIYNELGDSKRALTYLEDVFPNVISNMEFYSLKAIIATKIQDWKTANDSYLGILKVASHQGKWWYGLGISYQGLGQRELAISAFQTALGKSDLSVDYARDIDRRLRMLGG